MSEDWTSFDSAWLVKLAKVQHPELDWLVLALEACKEASFDGRSYYDFQRRERNNRLDPDLEFSRTIKLRDSEKGELVLDILKNGSVGGLELVDMYKS